MLDRVTEGAKPELVADLGATYHSGAIADIGFEPDVIIECTGVGQVIVDSIQQVGAGGVRLPHRASAAAAGPADCRRPTSPPSWCCRTT